jgi:hypothetical protein
VKDGKRYGKGICDLALGKFHARRLWSEGKGRGYRHQDVVFSFPRNYVSLRYKVVSSFCIFDQARAITAFSAVLTRDSEDPFGILVERAYLLEPR